MKNDTDSSAHWIRLFEKIKQWQHYQEPTVFLVFVDILLSANYKESWFKGHKVKRGELVTSVARICESTNLSDRTVKIALKKLEETGEIKKEATNKFTKITINQFNKYQYEVDNTQQGTHQGTHQSTHQSTQQGTHIIKVIEDVYVIDGVEIEKETFKEKVSAYAAEIHSQIDVNDFFNYYDANGWLVGKKPMKNWKLTVQTWTKKDKKERPWLYEDKPHNNVDYTKTAMQRRQGQWQ